MPPQPPTNKPNSSERSTGPENYRGLAADLEPGPGAAPSSLPPPPAEPVRPPLGQPTPASQDARLWIVNPARAGFIGWVLRYTLFAALCVLWLALMAAVSLYRDLARDLPAIDSIASYASQAPGVTQIYGNDGTLLAEIAREHRAYASFAEIPPELVQALVASEDRRFFSHGGLDLRGLARAAITNLRSGTVRQGGSTITQQVAKGFLSDEQTLTRKLREAILAVRLESTLSKDQILEIYLNKTFFGHNAYGVASAASRYFDKGLHELTLAECALIAGLARTPSRDSPFVSLERAKARRQVVLQDMVESGIISPQARDEADAEPIILATVPDVFRARAPYYADHVLSTVTAELGKDAVLKDGLRIETPLDPSVQAMAAWAVDEGLRKIDRRQGFRGPVAHLAEAEPQAEFTARAHRAYGDTPLSAQVCAPGPPHPRLELHCPNQEGALCEPEAQPVPEVADCEPRWRLALVDEVNKFNAWVRIGNTRAILPIRQMDWASRYDRNTGINDRKISDVTKALEPGDVVWVRAALEHRQPQAGNENIDLPEVELGQTPRVEAAIYSFDHQTGYVTALQGGHDYDRSQFNRATTGCRQPGSVFKAIYYALALDTRRFDMATVLEDRAYEPEPGEEWNPQNLHGSLSGEVLLRNAFIFSLNLPSIRLFQRLGADNVVQWARRLGFTSELIADKALSLGASCVHMDELSRAFGIFATGGQWIDPVAVRRITDKNGRVVLDQRHPWDAAMDVAGRIDAIAHQGLAPPEQVMDPQTAFLTAKLTRDVVTHGIGKYATRIGVPAAGKSGTASKNTYTTDTWFVGFTSRFVTAAWMGDDNYERSLGEEDASYTTATPMWTDFMARQVAGIPHRMVPVHRPAGIESRSVQYLGGEGTRSVVLYFASGT